MAIEIICEIQCQHIVIIVLQLDHRNEAHRQAHQVEEQAPEAPERRFGDTGPTSVVTRFH